MPVTQSRARVAVNNIPPVLLLCCAVLCCAVLCCAVLCCAVLGLQDADLIIMHEQERLVQDKGGWRKAYCMPHHTDAGVLALRWVCHTCNGFAGHGVRRLGPRAAHTNMGKLTFQQQGPCCSTSLSQLLVGAAYDCTCGAARTAAQALAGRCRACALQGRLPPGPHPAT